MMVERRTLHLKVILVAVCACIIIAALYIDKRRSIPPRLDNIGDQVIKIHLVNNEQTPKSLTSGENSPDDKGVSDEVELQAEISEDEAVNEKLPIQQSMPANEMEEALYEYMMTPTYVCDKEERMGHAGDGGWDICLDQDYAPSSGCLVYSFGIANDWSFDESMMNKYKCEVHSFDPSIKKTDHKHAASVWFHNMGISGSNSENPQGWKLRNVHTIRAMLGHSTRPIDVFKMDVETAEWGAIPSMIQTGEFKTIKQFCFELHFGPKPSADRMFQIYQFLDALVKSGLRLFKAHGNPACRYISEFTESSRNWCIELYYVNTRFKL